MWRCPKCRETVGKSFEVCWQCGTSRDGLENPDFPVEADDVDRIQVEDAVAARRAWSYTVRAQLVLMTLVALACVVAQGDRGLLLFTLLCVVAANAAGAILAAYVTYILRVNDNAHQIEEYYFQYDKAGWKHQKPVVQLTEAPE